MQAACAGLIGEYCQRSHHAVLVLQATIDVSKPEAASEYLLSAVLQPDLQQQLHTDLCQAVQLISTTLQLDHVHAKLQLIQQQSCPNWHADTVGMRLLCTYAGPGTWFVENRCEGGSVHVLLQAYVQHGTYKTQAVVPDGCMSWLSSQHVAGALALSC